jgi:hypothetical protein
MHLATWLNNHVYKIHAANCTLSDYWINPAANCTWLAVSNVDDSHTLTNCMWLNIKFFVVSGGAWLIASWGSHALALGMGHILRGVFWLQVLNPSLANFKAL